MTDGPALHGCEQYSVEHTVAVQPAQAVEERSNPTGLSETRKEILNGSRLVERDKERDTFCVNLGNRDQKELWRGGGSRQPLANGSLFLLGPMSVSAGRGQLVQQ